MTKGFSVTTGKSKAVAVTWYLVVAAIVVGFLTAYAAMFGYDKLREVLEGIGTKE